MTLSLFESSAPRPLADRLRPERLEDVAGQGHLTGPRGTIGRMVASGSLPSLIFWGPPGTGKTTLARILGARFGMEFEKLSAVLSGVADLRKVIEAAQGRRRGAGRGTVLFVDEIHRWSKSQQDSLLPYVEDGTVTLIGATSENPSFEVVGALLSRCQVVVLRRLDTEALDGLLRRAEAEIGWTLPLTPEARELLLAMADGDGRYLINLAETLAGAEPSERLGPEELLTVAQRKAVGHDKGGDGHHALISSLQKSIRGSDGAASLYWLARLLKAGEPPKAIFRRLAIMATEEIGLADPMAAVQVDACARNFDRLGEPEGLPVLGQCVLYLATAVKSNAAYEAFYAAMSLAEASGSVPPPKHLINAPTRMMREQGFKDGYKFDHQFEHAFSGQEFFPEGLDGDRRPDLYVPNERGNEREVLRRMRFWDELRAERRAGR